MLASLVGGVPGSVAMETAERAAEPFGQGLGEYAGHLLANMNPWGARVADPHAGEITSHLDPAQMARQAAISAALQRAQIAFHGSPYDFEKFSMDKVGTGTGAQSYAHGHYFAEDPAIGEKYLTGASGIDGSRRQGPRPAGRAYAVDLPENDQLLDYDKPLSEQPEAVRRALTGMRVPDEQITGKDLQTLLSRSVGPERTAELLRNRGIPGMRYTDNDAHSGARNFVIWDDSTIKPLAKAANYPDLQAQLSRLNALHSPEGGTP